MLYAMDRPLAPGEDAAVPHESSLPIAEKDLDRAFRLAGLILGSKDEAEDATQEALLKAWLHRRSIRRSESATAWFDRILVNVCRDRLRQRGRVRLVAPELGQDTPTTHDPFRELLDRDELLRALATLEPDGRVVVVLHYWADLTLEAVARHTGWRVGTVKSRLHRALAQLRTQIDGVASQEAKRARRS
jgi:RNA polymerase sigma-70 factor, ECF subfamily